MHWYSAGSSVGYEVAFKDITKKMEFGTNAIQLFVVWFLGGGKEKVEKTKEGQVSPSARLFDSDSGKKTLSKRTSPRFYLMTSSPSLNGA